MRRTLTILTLCLTVIVFCSCMNSKPATDNTFGYDCHGDMLIFSQIPENTDNTYWTTILDAVNEYRNSPDYARDDLTVRGEKIEVILSGFEGRYIAEDSIVCDSDCVSGSTLDGGTFRIGIHDLEWYASHH